MLKKIKRLLLASLLSCFLLTGCGKDQALDDYKANMTAFCESIISQNDTINSIDPYSESATEELLGSLDSLEAEFKSLADMAVPAQFSSVESLADEAGSYMSEAVALYREAFSAEEYDENIVAAANESYQRAVKRVQYIGEILMGNIPEGEGINVKYTDSTYSSEDIDAEEDSLPSSVSEEATESTGGSTSAE